MNIARHVSAVMCEYPVAVWVGNEREEKRPRTYAPIQPRFETHTTNRFERSYTRTHTQARCVKARGMCVRSKNIACVARQCRSDEKLDRASDEKRDARPIVFRGDSSTFRAETAPSAVSRSSVSSHCALVTASRDFLPLVLVHLRKRTVKALDVLSPLSNRDGQGSGYAAHSHLRLRRDQRERMCRYAGCTCCTDADEEWVTKHGHGTCVTLRFFGRFITPKGFATDEIACVSFTGQIPTHHPSRYFWKFRFVSFCNHVDIRYRSFVYRFINAQRIPGDWQCEWIGADW